MATTAASAPSFLAARRVPVAVRFPIAPVAAFGRGPRARAAAAQLVLGRSCRRRVVG